MCSLSLFYPAGHEYYRRRRASHASEPVTTFNSTNYIPAYVRERVEEQAREDARKRKHLLIVYIPSIIF